MTRIGVISDTHIPDRGSLIPPKVLEDFRKVEMIIHAGDLVNLHVLDQLKEVCSNVVAVCGNMDPQEVRNELPAKRIVQVGRYKIGVMHGFGAPGRLVEVLSKEFKDDPVDIIIFGHSHNAFNENIGGVLYFNPGSATDKVFAAFNSYGIIELNDKIEARIEKI